MQHPVFRSLNNPARDCLSEAELSAILIVLPALCLLIAHSCPLLPFPVSTSRAHLIENWQTTGLFGICFAMTHVSHYQTPINAGTPPPAGHGSLPSGNVPKWPFEYWFIVLVSHSLEICSLFQRDNVLVLYQYLGQVVTWMPSGGDEGEERHLTSSMDSLGLSLPLILALETHGTAALPGHLEVSLE